ncbi:hypothetical protein [Citricoccus nitrophenolicus]|uniref:hypothetical protein n=1 Tax=Citricoccus nitrophenolicus TaxID=863575 RepID=UPI003614BCD1
MLLHGRLCAGATAGSCVLHIFLVNSLHPWWLNLMIIVMVGVCVPCAAHIWHRPKVRALRQISIAALMMAALHAGLMLFQTPQGHVHGTQHSVMLQVTDAGNASTVAVIVVELLTALLASTLLARLRREGSAQTRCSDPHRGLVAARQRPEG